MDNIFETAKDKLNELSNDTMNLFKTDILSGIKDYGIEKMNEVWKQIEDSSGVFQRTGYSITGLELNLAVPPSILLSLDQIENISDEEEEKLLEENKGKAFLYPILVALFKANAIQRSINSVQYKFAGLTIGLGITPTIDMKFKKIS